MSTGHSKAGRQQAKAVCQPLSAAHTEELRALWHTEGDEDGQPAEDASLLHDLRRSTDAILQAPDMARQVRAVASLSLPLSRAKALPPTGQAQGLVDCLIGLLFDPALPAYHRAVLTALHGASPPVQEAAHRAFAAHLNRLCATAVATAKEAMYVCSVVARLIEHPVPVFHGPLRAGFPQMLRLMNAVLAHTVEVCVAHSAAGAAGGGGTQAMDDCQQALRTTAHLVQKNKAALQADDPTAVGRQEVDGLAQLALAVLQCGPLGKEVFTSAGILLASIVTEIGGDAPPALDRLAGLLLRVCQNNGAPDHAATSLAEALADLFGGEGLTFCGWLQRHLSIVSQLCLVRAILNLSDAPLFLRRVAPTPGAPAAQLLADGLLPLVTRCCAHPAPTAVKFVGIQTLQLCLRQWAQFLQRVNDHLVGAAAVTEQDPPPGDAEDPQADSEAEGTEPPPDGSSSAASIAGHTDLAVYDATLRSCLRAALEVVWHTTDDPAQLLHQHLKPLLDDVVAIHSAALRIHRRRHAADPPAALDLVQICEEVLAFGWERRSKYQSLAVLVVHVGTGPVLQRCPTLLADCFPAMASLANSSQVAQTLRHVMLECHHLRAADDSYSQYWREGCLRPLAASLMQPDTAPNAARCRSAVLSHLLPALLTDISDFLPELLEALRTHRRPVGDGPAAYLAAFVQVLLKAKALAVVEDVTREEWLGEVEAALVHASQPLRLAALELVTASARTVAPPVVAECRLVERFLTRNLKSPSQAFRNDFYVLLRKWFRRLRNVLDRGQRQVSRREVDDDSEADTEAQVTRVTAHVHCLATFLCHSIVPGASLDRLLGAVTGLHLLLLHFDAARCLPAEPAPLVAALLLGLRQPWERLRAAIFDLLDYLPTPLPGVAGPTRIEQVGGWALGLLRQPKSRECDAGSHLWRLLNKKYNVALGYIFSLEDDKVQILAAEAEDQQCVRAPSLSPIACQRRHLRLALAFCGLLAGLARGCEGLAFRPLHGVLQAIRFLLRDAAFEAFMPAAAAEAAVAALSDRQRRTRKLRPPSATAVGNGEESEADQLIVGWRGAVETILGTLQGTLDVALRLIAGGYGVYEDSPEGGDEADADDGAEEGDADEGSEAGSPGRVLLGTDCRGHPIFADSDPHNDRILVVNCWQAVKEGALLMGALLECVPLTEDAHRSIVSVAQVRAVGGLLMSILLRTKHNGAIAKAQEGFSLVCRRLLRCGIPELVQLPGLWLDHLLSSAGVLSADYRRILRRSAGLPLAVLAVLDAEDRLLPQPLLQRCAAALLEVAGQDPAGDAHREFSRVNALNVLRYVMDDSLLGPDVQPYVGPALVLCLRGFEHDSWAIRNSSMMLYSAVVTRAVGDQRNRKGRTTVTDFVVRFPEVAAEFLCYLEKATSGSIDTQLHPCLYPILLLFASLSAEGDVSQPELSNASEEESETCAEGDSAAVSPQPPAASTLVQQQLAHFRDLIAGCRSIRTYMARSIAAQALVPFVPSHHLRDFLRHGLLPLLPAAPPGPPAPATANARHGTLLQLAALLRAHAPPAASAGPAAWAPTWQCVVEGLLQEGRLERLLCYAPPTPGTPPVCPLNVSLCCQLCLWLLEVAPVPLDGAAPHLILYQDFLRRLAAATVATLEASAAAPDFPGIGFHAMAADAAHLRLQCLDRLAALGGAEEGWGLHAAVRATATAGPTLQYLRAAAPPAVLADAAVRQAVLGQVLALRSTLRDPEAIERASSALRVASRVYGEPERGAALPADLQLAGRTLADLWAWLAALQNPSTPLALWQDVPPLMAVVLRAALLAPDAAEPLAGMAQRFMALLAELAAPE
eukprot:EG_transcript_175